MCSEHPHTPAAPSRQNKDQMALRLIRFDPLASLLVGADHGIERSPKRPPIAATHRDQSTPKRQEVQKFRSSEVQKFRSSEVQKFRSSEVSIA